MQINSINNTQSFGMAYRVGTEAQKEIVKVAKKSNKYLANMQALQDVFGGVSDTFEIRKPLQKSKKLFKSNKLLVSLENNMGSAKTKVKPSKLAKNPFEVVNDLSAKIIKNAEVSSKKKIAAELAEKTANNMG